jgi:glycosyltransferase involved in cell wall biosynthesis
MSGAGPLTVFYAYRDAPERRRALASPSRSPERYRLFGLDELAARGARVRHNLERERPARWAQLSSRAVNTVLARLGGYGGDFASILSTLEAANSSDVIVATVDTVGIPLVLLKSVGLVRPPIVYVAIGLPERLVQLRTRVARRWYANAFRRTSAIVSYAESEAQWLRAWLSPGAPPVLFVPFGVDVELFRPVEDAVAELDVVSIGADPRRDFALLLEVARRRRELTFALVTTGDQARTLRTVPDNVVVETDVPLEHVRARLAAARVVALPVRDNSYSGATTTLLQAMAMGKPVVVSRTEAIASGYELADGVNCRLVEPGDVDALDQTILELLAGAAAALSLGNRARETVERSLSWERYTDALWEVLSEAARATSR